MLQCQESRGWCLSHRNVAHIKSITRCERIPPVTSQRCELGENMFSWALEESPPFGWWFNLKCILGERERKRGRGDVLQQIATSILSLGRQSWTRGCGSVGCAVFLSWIVSLRETQEKETSCQSRKPLTKRPASCLTAEQSHFWAVLAFKSYKCALPLSSSPMKR